MSVMQGSELRIVGFLCNWCSYGGADTAGVARATQPTDLRIVRVPCSGRIDPLFVIRTLLNGADGVLVSGCHPRDCHYSAGNFYARRRLEMLKHFLPVLGIDPKRFEYTWVSASEGQRWQHVVTTFTKQIHDLGPAKRIEDATALMKVADMTLSPMRELTTGQKNQLDELKKSIKEKLPELDCVIAWQEGHDKIHTVPLFIRKEEDIDKLVWGPFNVNNPAVYLPDFKDKKVGIVVKGCDSRSVVELLQENLIDKENVTIFAMPCGGTLDMARVDQKIGRHKHIDDVTFDDTSVTVTKDSEKITFKMQEFAQGKCYGCTRPAAVLADFRFGTPAPITAKPFTPPELAMLDSMSLDERMGFWKAQMDRCLRCYACRNACPMCVCRDYCVSDSRDPHWMTQEASVKEKLFFQTIHAMHLAGRCTGCGECQRACPVGIPILALRQQLGRALGQIFEGYVTGLNPDDTPPLLGYEVEEKNIHERDW